MWYPCWGWRPLVPLTVSSTSYPPPISCVLATHPTVALVTVEPIWPAGPVVSLRSTVTVGWVAPVAHSANAVTVSVEAGLPAEPYVDQEVALVEPFAALKPAEFE